MQGKTVKL